MYHDNNTHVRILVCGTYGCRVIVSVSRLPDVSLQRSRWKDPWTVWPPPAEYLAGRSRTHKPTRKIPNCPYTSSWTRILWLQSYVCMRQLIQRHVDYGVLWFPGHPTAFGGYTYISIKNCSKLVRNLIFSHRNIRKHSAVLQSNIFREPYRRVDHRRFLYFILGVLGWFEN